VGSLRVSYMCYEHFRLRSLPRLTALHVALGAGLDSFGLAAAANVHALLTGTGSLRLLRIALLVWPVITTIPAFIVAFTVSSLLLRPNGGKTGSDRSAGRW